MEEGGWGCTRGAGAASPRSFLIDQMVAAAPYVEAACCRRRPTPLRDEGCREGGPHPSDIVAHNPTVEALMAKRPVFPEGG